MNLKGRIVLEQKETKLTDDCSGNKIVTEQKWIIDETLPEGWKMSFIESDNQRKDDMNKALTKYQFLSPEGLIFNSREQVLEQYLLDISAHDIEDEKYILDVDSEKVVENKEYGIVDDQNKERPFDKSD